eukprot:TRINITY_DN2278_c0_g1_i7.p1 TRINITY_DN2278_c0_g1~~TRINITY_DN2278_c0_g1_i7.p1  ORF type:complete len:185 (+),score=25.81 TRINITY_DN2278_c0_g1_i7:100-654(+)
MQKLRDYANSKQLLKNLSQNLGVPAEYILIGLALLAAGLLFSNNGGMYLLVLTAFLYPAYQTFKALKKDDFELLAGYGKYWVIAALVTAVHKVLMWFFPLQQHLIILTLAGTLVLLKSRAAVAVAVYDTIAESMMKRVEPKVDSALNLAKEKVREKKAKVESKISIEPGYETRIRELFLKDFCL